MDRPSDLPADDRTPTPVSPWRAAFLVVVTGLVALHLTAVTFAAVPPNPASTAIEPSTVYLQPYFTQSWRLFAPNPIAQDRSVRFQVTYRDEAGDLQRSRWIDWTGVELDLVRHRLVGGRAGYVTNKMIEGLSRNYRQLGTQQREVLASVPADAPLSWSALDDALAEAGVPPQRRAGFLRYERSTAQLATDVARSRFPGDEIVAVRYAVVVRAVTPYAERGGSDAEREAARPPASQRASGWLAPVEGSVAERRAVATFDARHR